MLYFYEIAANLKQFSSNTINKSLRENPVPYPLATDTTLLIHKPKLMALVTDSPDTVTFTPRKKLPVLKTEPP